MIRASREFSFMEGKKVVIMRATPVMLVLKV